MAKIFYWMTEVDSPAGGEKHHYEHVDLLNAAGFEAYAVHLTRDRSTWFENTTAIVRGADFWEMFDPRRDFMVVPEVMGHLITAFPGRKVVFNKNLYQGFRRPGDIDKPRPAYQDPRVVAIFSVSEHNCQHLKFAYPKAPVMRMYAALDPELHTYRPLDQKKPRIAVVWKTLEPLGILMEMLQARAEAGANNLNDFEITFLRGLPLREAARVVGESVLLVSLSTYEGLPRTILEGMAAGCVVGAYGTGPLKEILPREYAIEPDDLIGMARHVEAVAAAFPRDMTRWSSVLEHARHTAAAFTRERQRDVLVDAWTRILAA